MRRILLIAFQSLLAVAAFGISAFQFVNRSSEVPASAQAFRWVTVASFFLIGVLGVVLAGRHLLRIGKAYDEAPE